MCESAPRDEHVADVVQQRRTERQSNSTRLKGQTRANIAPPPVAIPSRAYTSAVDHGGDDREEQGRPTQAARCNVTPGVNW
eukprot:CAMPEP_0175859534 /NCGR_PEP_ID=MMETSP0107_2-20121207/30312_1 /TAXON_ID=195067 ORGANISM="Goniomonas pacifica, Strain CCMP1869" /NCGR_SAMPLE_ID=MMETSP0107_2 /ASSEMBLY_ACC=CAM_ASM_000203 /LENGTH=80 /DNA_ID=CAMNT_0017176171 /DNA_START=688 /DNA_END=930 /DNA_ORIENTATION=+